MSNNIPKKLLKACQENKLIPVVGAGVSMSLTDTDKKRIFPSWIELLKHAEDELRDSGKLKLANGISAMLDLEDFQQAAKYARQGLQGTCWSNFFRKHFEEPLNLISEDSKDLPKAIWELSNRVVTLNYDKVMRITSPNIENIIPLDNSNPAGLADFKRGDHTGPAIWHLHGHVDNVDTIIFTTESYDKLYAETSEAHKAALESFKGLCSDQKLLFVGCSLEDAELLHEMGKQHQLFGGNTGPHYALVHKNEHETIQQKINDLPIDLLPFEDFGEPLVQLVKKIANPTQAPEPIEQPKIETLPVQPKPQAKKIALLSANPLNNEQDYSEHLAAFKKIACPIDHFSLSIEKLNELDGYDTLLILTKVIRNKVLIEDDDLCQTRISFQALEAEIGDDAINKVIYFTDQLPDESITLELEKPTICIVGTEKKQISSSIFQLFKKADLSKIQNALMFNESNFILQPLKGKYSVNQDKTLLPNEIDPKTVRNFVGREGDLEQICQKLLDLKDSILTIKGSGGIGKTTTVKKIIVALAERGFFEGGIIFVDCEAITSYQQFKFQVAAAFNLEQAEYLEQHLEQHYDQESRLIILDNFETLLHLNDHDEIKSFLDFICDFASIIVTSRERLQVEGEIVYEMRQFTTDEAEQLFLSDLEQYQINSSERKILRQDILENLLDNNPLAIILITSNMPKGKRLDALKKELEIDLFKKISDMELSVFDAETDINIARKKSVYGSILYSYRYLTDPEKHAFELLSLFPAGIDLENFKRLTRFDKTKATNSQHKPMITDKIIKSLENKSMIENNSGLIKLQSIVGRFAEAQLVERDDLDRYYINAFEFNHRITSAIYNYGFKNINKALSVFNNQQGNFLKCISYIDKINNDFSETFDFLDKLKSLFIDICSLKDFINEIQLKLESLSSERKQSVNIILLAARYFNGDFSRVFIELKQTSPLSSITLLDRTKSVERIISSIALNIYEMEGEALYVAEYESQIKRPSLFYPHSLIHLGEYDKNLTELCHNDFFSFDTAANMGLLKLNTIEEYCNELHEKSHLERMQASYLQSKLTPLTQEQIKGLVTVNPYTNGLKKLMLAFVEQDAAEAHTLYQQAIEQLQHIKYYYVEAIYFMLNIFKYNTLKNLIAFTSRD